MPLHWIILTSWSGLQLKCNFFREVFPDYSCPCLSPTRFRDILSCVLPERASCLDFTVFACFKCLSLPQDCSLLEGPGLYFVCSCIPDAMITCIARKRHDWRYVVFAVHNTLFLSYLRYARALCYLKLCQFEEAKQDCDRALQIDDGSVKARYRRALAHKGLKVRKSSVVFFFIEFFFLFI